MEIGMIKNDSPAQTSSGSISIKSDNGFEALLSLLSNISLETEKINPGSGNTAALTNSSFSSTKSLDINSLNQLVNTLKGLNGENLLKDLKGFLGNDKSNPLSIIKDLLKSLKSNKKIANDTSLQKLLKDRLDQTNLLYPLSGSFMMSNPDAESVGTSSDLSSSNSKNSTVQNVIINANTAPVLQETGGLVQNSANNDGLPGSPPLDRIISLVNRDMQVQRDTQDMIRNLLQRTSANADNNPTDVSGTVQSGSGSTKADNVQAKQFSGGDSTAASNLLLNKIINLINKDIDANVVTKQMLDSLLEAPNTGTGSNTSNASSTTSLADFLSTNADSSGQLQVPDGLVQYSVGDNDIFNSVPMEKILNLIGRDVKAQSITQDMIKGLLLKTADTDPSKLQANDISQANGTNSITNNLLGEVNSSAETKDNFVNNAVLPGITDNAQNQAAADKVQTSGITESLNNSLENKAAGTESIPVKPVSYGNFHNKTLTGQNPGIYTATKGDAKASNYNSAQNSQQANSQVVLKDSKTTLNDVSNTKISDVSTKDKNTNSSAYDEFYPDQNAVHTESNTGSLAEVSQTSAPSGILQNEDLMNQVINGFKVLKLPDITELKVNLKPEELGEITVKVSLEKGQVNGIITTDNKHLANMLQNQMDGLREQLKSNNINLNSLSVNVNSQSDFRGQNSRQFFKQEKRQPRTYMENVEEKNAQTQNENFTIIA